MHSAVNVVPTHAIKVLERPTARGTGLARYRSLGNLSPIFLSTERAKSYQCLCWMNIIARLSWVARLYSHYISWKYWEELSLSRGRRRKFYKKQFLVTFLASSKLIKNMNALFWVCKHTYYHVKRASNSGLLFHAFWSATAGNIHCTCV
jgi:hypothetical protein